jgi:exodeoxyribonuclease V beta subunit
LAVSTFDHRFQNAHRRHSFSSIATPATSNHAEVMVAADDELVGARAGDIEVSGAAHTVSPLATIRTAGTEFGTAFHSVMEALDFTAPMPTEADRVLDITWPWRALPVDRATLTAGIEGVLLSPTGACFDGLPLARLPRRDRLDELVFELPLATSGPPVRAAEIAAVLSDHLADDDPFRPYAGTLLGGGFDTELAGHLNGSIDLVARVYDAERQPRFIICDYKTNRLSDYHPQHLPAAMVEHHYPLQALLYGVALHRYLRWRQPGYDPGRHLGGVAYLFVRGMAGPATQVVEGAPFGVCSWAVPPALTVALSDLLDGRRP